MNEPPLGLTPRWVQDEIRLMDIVNAMHRYVSKNRPIPLEWIDETIGITKRQHIRKEVTRNEYRQSQQRVSCLAER